MSGEMATPNNSPATADSTSSPSPQYIEAHPSGYPRFAALLATHPSFHLCRRFLRLRARLLLYQQDALSQLEAQLDNVDRTEPRVLFLGNWRRDTNEERKDLMQKIDAGLRGYDKLVKQNRRILELETAKDRDVTNLKNWLDDTGCISREETKYLTQQSDLMALGSFETDGAVSGLEEPLEDAVIWASRKLGKNARSDVSQDPNIYILSRSLLGRIRRSVLACFLVLLLFIPIIVVQALKNVALRILVIILSSALFISVLGILTKAKTADVFMAGATYATVLVVFISGSGKA